MSGSKIEIVAEVFSPMIRGWLQYFSKYSSASVKYTMDCINRRLINWAMSKYKRFRNHRRRTVEWMKEIARKEPNMFPHWALGYMP